MEIFTIGYTKKSAAEFFELLKRHGLRSVLDIRLNNTSQLAGFSKRDSTLTSVDFPAPFGPTIR